VQAATFLIAGIVMLFNLMADLLYSRLDPRIKLDTVS
jgi:peptide/nickel transport system permease protein